MVEDTDEPEDDDGSEIAEAVEAEANFLSIEDNELRWLLGIHQITSEIFEHDIFHCPRVEHAYNCYLIAAFERATRILRSDLPHEECS